MTPSSYAAMPTPIPPTSLPGCCRLLPGLVPFVAVVTCRGTTTTNVPTATWFLQRFRPATRFWELLPARNTLPSCGATNACLVVRAAGRAPAYHQYLPPLPAATTAAPTTARGVSISYRPKYLRPELPSPPATYHSRKTFLCGQATGGGR